MPTFTMTTNVDVLFIECASCGTTFGMTSNLNKKLRENGNTFYCPSGHHNVYRDTEAKKLKEQLKAKDDELLRTKRRLEWEESNAARAHDALDAAKKRLATTKATLTRTKARIANGVCPCCNRTFVDLHRHMAGQHPEYQAEETVSALPALLDSAGAPPAPKGEDMNPDTNAAPAEELPIWNQQARVMERFAKGMRAAAIAEELGLSRARVYQLRDRARKEAE